MNRIYKIIFILFISLLYFNTYASKQVYAVIVGVADYKYDRLKLDLHYSDDDARAFYRLLISSGVPAKNIALLIDEKASKSNIITKLHTVFSKAREQDEVIFYFSGHGDKNFFVPYDFDGNSYSLLEFSIIKASFKHCKARKKFCIADACLSGSIKKTSSNSSSQASQSYSKGNVIVFMSSRANQFSKETSTLKHGVFTYYFLKGLKGEADTNGDKIITVEEMYYYTRKKVIQKTNNKQVPIIFGRFDRDLPVIKLK